MKAQASSRSWGRAALTLGPLVFLVGAAAGLQLAVDPSAPLRWIALATAIAFLAALLGGESLRRVGVPAVLAYAVAGLWLSFADPVVLVGPLWPHLAAIGLGIVGLAFGRVAAAVPPATWRLGIAAGATVAGAGFATTVVGALLLEGILGRTGAPLPVRLAAATSWGLAAIVIHPWFVAAVVAMRLARRRVSEVAILATVTSVVLAIGVQLLLGTVTLFDLRFTALLAIVGGLAGARLARRARHLAPAVSLAAIVLVGMLAPDRVHPLLVFFAAGWAYGAPSGPDGLLDPPIRSGLEAAALVYFVLVASARVLPGDATIGVAGAVLTVARIGAIVLAMRSLSQGWNLGYGEMRLLPVLLVVGGGWEAVGRVALADVPGMLFVQELLPVAVAAVWVAARERSADEAVRIGPEGAGAPRHARSTVRRRYFHDRWLDSGVADATRRLVAVHEGLEEALGVLNERTAARIADLDRIVRTDAAHDADGLREAIGRARAWTQQRLRDGVFEAYLSDVARTIDPRVVLRVPLEEAFLTPARSDGWPTRALKAARRARRRAFGHTERTVRLGRAWRERVVRPLPVALEAAMRDHFDALTALEDALVDVTVEAIRGGAGIAPVAGPGDTTRALARLREQVDEERDRVLARLALRLGELHRDFVRQVARDGTVQGARGVTTPIAEARRAARALTTHAAEFRSCSRARWQRVELELELARVALWLGAFREGVAQDLEATVRLPSVGADGSAPDRLAALRGLLGERITDCARHVPGTDATRRFEWRVARLPEVLVVSARATGARAAERTEVVSLDLRRFVQQGIAEAAAVAVVQAIRDLERRLRRARAALVDGVDLQAWAAELERDAGEVRAQLATRFDEIRAGLTKVTSRFVSRDQASELPPAAVTRRVQPFVGWLREVALPTLGAVTRDVRDELRPRHREEQREHVRAYDAQLRLGPQLPDHYRRLFDPGLLDVAGFFVERPDVEARLVEALEGRGPRGAATILLHGERGSGKTAVLQHVLPRVHADHLHEVRLRRDQPLLEALAAVLGATVPSLSVLEHALRTGPEGRRLLILDDFEEAFERTPEGLQAISGFLDFMGRTSDRVAWVVVVRTPTARFLDLALRLFDAFDAVVEVPPLDAREARRMVMERHRASGYAVEVRPASAETWRGLLQRITPPRFRGRRALFDALTRRAEGNAELIQQLWLASVEVDTARACVRATVPAAPPFDLKELLSDEQRSLAAALVLHRALGVEEAARIVRRSPIDLRRDLAYLERLGFVLPSGPGLRFELNPSFALRVARQLELEHRL